MTMIPSCVVAYCDTAPLLPEIQASSLLLGRVVWSKKPIPCRTASCNGGVSESISTILSPPETASIWHRQNRERFPSGRKDISGKQLTLIGLIRDDGHISPYPATLLTGNLCYLLGHVDGDPEVALASSQRCHSRVSFTSLRRHTCYCCQQQAIVHYGSSPNYLPPLLQL